ncbi:MAG: hypothetical protein Q8J78_13395 [Moraxellaceae bacterium]|nr:hypothetical protein [Moraxellaceae bacterium]
MSTKGAGRWTALVVTSFVAHVALTLNNTETALWNEQGRHGALLVQQLADAAAPVILARDMVSLSVLTARYESHPSTASLQLYNANNELIAEAGTPDGSGRLFTAPLDVQRRALGTADLRLRTPGRADIIRASLGNLGLSALLHGLLLAGGLLMTGRREAPMRSGAEPLRQATPATASVGTSLPVTATTEPVAVSAPVPASYLHLALDDPNGLLHRVNVAMADDLLTLLDQFIDRAARLYGGEVMTPFSPDGVSVRFAGDAGADRELRALAAARLFLQLIEDSTETRRENGQLCLHCKAGLMLNGEQIALTSVIAYTAPGGRILTTLPGPNVELPCRLGTSFRLAVSSDRALQVALVESFAPEYQQLIRNQSLQILAPASSDAEPDFEADNIR